MALGAGLTAAIPAKGAVATLGAGAQRSKYIFAVALAHARNDVSAEMISETFGVRPSTARGFISKMVRNGVVDAPNAKGIATLAKPLQRIVPEVVVYNPTGGYVVKGPVSELREKAIKLARDSLNLETESAENAEIEVSPLDDDCVPPEVSDAERSAG